MSALLWLLVSGAASADAPRFEGELRTLELDDAGGLQGAPTGMAFIVPPGADANVEVMDLGDGARGARMSVRTPSDALLCTTSVPLGSVAMVKARLRVTGIQPGPGSWTGMNFELRARDGSGALVSPAGSMYALIRNEREAGGWIDVSQKVLVPEGADRGEFCFRFVLSTGVVEIDRLSIAAPRKGTGVAASAPALTSMPAVPPAAPPSVASPSFVAPAPVAEAAPAFVAPAPVAAAPVVAYEPALAPGPVAESAQEIADERELRRTLGVDTVEVWSGARCSAWFPARKDLRIEGDITLTALTASAPDWSGIVIEAYHQDERGLSLPVGAPPFLPVYAAVAASMAPHFTVHHRAPRGATRSRLCVRYAGAAGTTDLEWL